MDKVPFQDKTISQASAKNCLREDSYSTYSKLVPKQGRDMKLINKSIVKKTKSQNKTVYENSIVSLSKDLSSKISHNKSKITNTMNSYKATNTYSTNYQQPRSENVSGRNSARASHSKGEYNELPSEKAEEFLDQTVISSYKDYHGENVYLNLGSLLVDTNDTIYTFCKVVDKFSWIQ